MTQFLTTRNIESAIEDLIKHARNTLTFITPYLQVTDLMLQRLRDAAGRGVYITVVCRSEDLKKDQRRELISIQNLTLRFMSHLHAKCYVNEREAILTSMNLYDASRKNREMGVLLTNREDAYQDMLKEVDSILANSSIHSGPTSKKKTDVLHPVSTHAEAYTKPFEGEGVCIRCSAFIPFKVTAPLCKSCFGKWAKYKKKDYPEKFCHRCGKSKPKIKFSTPECYTCWKAYASTK